MEFFLPGVNDTAIAEEIYDAIRKHVAEETTQSVTDGNRIRSIDFQHDSDKFTATVGEPEPRSCERVYAILELGTIYAICTTNRGVVRGFPIVVGKHDTLHVEPFD